MKKRFFVNLILICLMLFAIQLYIDNNVIEVSNYEIIFENLPQNFDNTVIVHISDLHSKSFGEKNERLLTKIDEANPSYVVLTGDMVNATDVKFDVFLNFAKELAKKYETYYIVGNHELDLNEEDISKIKTILNDFGITILDNESVTLVRGEQSIKLHGLWYNSKYYFGEQFNVDSMEEILGQDVDFDILLTHNPKDFNTYSEWGAELILTGHVHGGMVRMPFVRAVFSPERVLFPKYSEGVYTMNDSRMIVSRGLGRGLTGFRLFNRPELVVITLKTN